MGGADGNTVSKTVPSGDTVRYSAPELIRESNPSSTKHSDTYSFAMLILERIPEEVPFPNLSRDAAVIHARIGKEQCPPRPDGQDLKKRVSDGLWGLMMRCWSAKPDRRPTMEVVHRLFLAQACDTNIYNVFIDKDSVQHHVVKHKGEGILGKDPNIACGGNIF